MSQRRTLEQAMLTDAIKAGTLGLLRTWSGTAPPENNLQGLKSKLRSKISPPTFQYKWFKNAKNTVSQSRLLLWTLIYRQSCHPITWRSAPAHTRPWSLGLQLRSKLIKYSIKKPSQEFRTKEVTNLLLIVLCSVLFKLRSGFIHPIML